MRHLVTGGGGFIGSHLVEALLARGQEVVVLDDFSGGREHNLAAVAGRFELVRGTICDPEAVARACRGVDIVFHQAARTSVPRSVEAPLETNQVNVEGTLNVLAAARDAGVRRVIFAASSAVYGESPALPKVETMEPAPISPYGVSKLAGELYAVVFARTYGLETVSLRYFNVFGPRQDAASPYSGVLAKFITALLAGQTPVVFGDGEQSRDFTYVENVVQANLLAAEASGVSGRVFNIGTGTRHTLNQTLDLLGKIIGRPARAEYRAPRPGDIEHSLADITLARKLLGYDPRVGFEEGLRRTVDWYRASSPGQEPAAG